MLKNAYLLAKIGADTTEKEQTCAGIFTKFRDVPREARRDLFFRSQLVP